MDMSQEQFSIIAAGLLQEALQLAPNVCTGSLGMCTCSPLTKVQASKD